MSVSRPGTPSVASGPEALQTLQALGLTAVAERLYRALLRGPDGTLRELAATGVRIALDDFGTGYSSLAHLRQLPINEVKVDRSFVSRINTDPADAIVVRSTLDLASL